MIAVLILLSDLLEKLVLSRDAFGKWECTHFYNGELGSWELGIGIEAGRKRGWEVTQCSVLIDTPWAQR